MAGTSVEQAGVDPIDYAAIVASWSPEERKGREKKFLRKIDARLIPILVSSKSKRYNWREADQQKFIMYIMNYIDRNALPHARVQGLEDDLGLKGVQYNIVLSLTFIGYILMQGQLPF